MIFVTVVTVVNVGVFMLNNGFYESERKILRGFDGHVTVTYAQ